jgi:cytochrome c oxidase assembly protein subunit 15
MSPFARKVVGVWLLLGCFMFAIQVSLGGITRLTESGLSITEWKPIKGTVPPLNEDEWNAEFELYKQKIQYKVINEGMTLHEFKWIYFWEYFHRLWARLIAVVFIIPFIYFLFKKYLETKVIIALIALFLFGALQGLAGWIMVKGGLTGLFVPPLRLTVHLILALILIASLLWLTLYVMRPAVSPLTESGRQKLKGLKALSIGIVMVLALQIFLGGILSGMKAGLAYPTWPDMNGEWVPQALTTLPATFAGLFHYDPQDFWGRTFIQFTHRLTAYTLVLLVIIFFVRARNITTDKVFQAGLSFFPIAVLLQATIGILTVVNCIGKVPVSWGVLHQAGAMLLMSVTVFIVFHLYHSGGKIKS